MTEAALLEIAQEAEFAVRESLRQKRHAAPIRRARKTVELVLERYWNRQRNAVMGGVLERHHLIEASGKTNAKKLVPDDVVYFPASQSEESEYLLAMREAMEEARDVLAHDLGIPKPNTVGSISEYLREHSLTKLTGGLNETTVDRLRDAIATAYDEGGGFAEVVEAIRNTFDEFGEARAGMIAQTEVNAAYNASRHATAQEAGLDEKRWEPDGDACEEICMPNVDQDWIAIDDTFDSGDDAPPAHPNCDCSVSFRKVSGGDEDDGEE
jgi:Phage Mu protein F like protein